jgi:putative transposase
MRILPGTRWFDTPPHSSSDPVVRHLIAQRDIEWSNSMIEAANKHLKYHFLYHHHIANHAALVTYVAEAVDQYNHRPHHVLQGLSPFEVLDGKRFDAEAHCHRIELAKQHRLTENKKESCCRYSF